MKIYTNVPSIPAYSLVKGYAAGLTNAAVLDHPANGICWLAKRFAPHGVCLEPGQMLLSGSFTAPIAVTRGDFIKAD